jgi:hypothetical protein
MREVTDGSRYKQAISRYTKGETGLPPSDLNLGAGSNVEDPHQPFLISLEQYQDSTGTDNKESSCLEPLVLTTSYMFLQMDDMFKLSLGIVAMDGGKFLHIILVKNPHLL